MPEWELDEAIVVKARLIAVTQGVPFQEALRRAIEQHVAWYRQALEAARDEDEAGESPA